LRSGATIGIVASAAKESRVYGEGGRIMVSVIAFLCALALSPSECSRATAIDIIALPPAPDRESCLRIAQTTLAELAIRADAEHRWIVKCGSGNQGMGPVG